MRFAPVMPIELYPRLDRGTYHMIQAHTLAGNRYMRSWFCRLAAFGHEVILDNGTIELGSPDTKSLIDVARKVRPTTVVVPDAYMDGPMTTVLARKWLATCARHSKHVMIVPHGQSLCEWCDVADQLIEMASIFSFIVGVPKVLDSMQAQGRLAAVNHLVDVGIAPSNIHLLGVWDGLDDLERVVRCFPGLRGYDTTLPVAAGLNESDMSEKFTISDEQWDMTLDQLTERKSNQCRVNIAKCQELIANRAPSGPVQLSMDLEQAPSMPA